jgi:hypothetical protein
VSSAEKATKKGVKVAAKAGKVLEVEAMKGGAKVAAKAAKGLSATAKKLEADAKKASLTTRPKVRRATTKAKTTRKK